MGKTEGLLAQAAVAHMVVGLLHLLLQELAALSVLFGPVMNANSLQPEQPTNRWRLPCG